MRKLYYLAGLAAVGLGLASWATMSTAQPKDADGEEPMVVPQVELPKGKQVSKPIPLPRSAEPLRLPDKLPAVSDTGVPPIVPGKPTRTIPGADPLEKPGTLLLPGIEPERGTGIETTKIGDDRPAKAPAAGLVPGSKQEPAVSLEWHGPASAKLGLPADYSLVVRNTCAIPLQKVVVQVRVPPGLKVKVTAPKADDAEGVLLWDLGTLASKQEKSLQISLLGEGKGDQTCQAWVTFTGSTVMRVQVREPKLALKASVPGKITLGETTDFVFTVTNPGDHPAEKARISVTLPEGLESARGRKLSYDLGNVQPGETRTLQVPCVARAGGEQRAEAVVEGDGLKAADSATVMVTEPKLQLEVTGPKMRYLDRKAVYSFKVTNPGDAPAANVTISEILPQGFKFVAADSGGQNDLATRSVKWNIGDVAPGQSKEVKLEVLAINAGDHTHKVVASGRGVKAERDLATKVEGLSAILMELVDVDDPIEVSSETVYEIRVTNTGSKTETDIKLSCTIPPQMELKSAQGPVKYTHTGGELTFETLPQLAARADAVYKVVVKAKAKGDARFKAQLTTGSLIEPVVKVESTRVYDD